MNLSQRLATIAKSSPDARPLSDVVMNQVSRGDIAARSESALRQHMKSQGRSDADVDCYLGKSDIKRAVAA